MSKICPVCKEHICKDEINDYWDKEYNMCRDCAIVAMVKEERRLLELRQKRLELLSINIKNLIQWKENVGYLKGIGA